MSRPSTSTAAKQLLKLGVAPIAACTRLRFDLHAGFGTHI